MSSALLVLSSSPLYVKTSSPIQLPHSINSKNLAIRHNVHPSPTRVRHDKRMCAHAGEKEDRHVPFRHYMVAMVLAATLLVSSPPVLPAAAAESYTIDWQSLIKPSSPSSDSSSPSTQPPPPSSETPVSPEELAKLQRQADKEARLLAKAEARERAAAARARPPVTAPPAPPVRSQRAPAKAAVEAPKVAAGGKARSHGFLPLFLSQFLLLGGVAGAVAALIKLPEAKWAELTKRVDSAVEKASPSIVSAWEASQPVAKEVFATTQRLAVEAAPYVVKAAKAAKPLVLEAAEAAKPLVLKAVEAAKPLLQQGRQKVEDLIQSAQETGDGTQTTRGTGGGKEGEVVGVVKKGMESVGDGVKGEGVRIEAEAGSQRGGGGAQSDK